VVRADGFVWHYDHGGGHEDHLGPSGHEHQLAPFLRTFLGSGVFLDVGAHVGHWTVRLAPQARKVIAIEANPDTAGVLRINIAMNKLRNVAVHNVAAWDNDTNLALFNFAGVARSGGVRVREDPAGTIPGCRLDTLLAAEQAVDLVKLDVEGADLHALEGMRGLLGKHRPVMLIERHDMYGYYDFRDLEVLIASLGYDITPAWAQYFVAQPVKLSCGMPGPDSSPGPGPARERGWE
jgi:FkbM family methyltransferase